MMLYETIALRAQKASFAVDRMRWDVRRAECFGRCSGFEESTPSFSARAQYSAVCVHSRLVGSSRSQYFSVVVQSHISPRPHPRLDRYTFLRLLVVVPTMYIPAWGIYHILADPSWQLLLQHRLATL